MKRLASEFSRRFLSSALIAAMCLSPLPTIPAHAQEEASSYAVRVLITDHTGDAFPLCAELQALSDDGTATAVREESESGQTPVHQTLQSEEDECVFSVEKEGDYRIALFASEQDESSGITLQERRGVLVSQEAEDTGEGSLLRVTIDPEEPKPAPSFRSPASGDYSVRFRIQWDDQDNSLAVEGTRPSSVTLTLLKDGEVCTDSQGNAITQTVTAAEDWTATFTGLEKGEYSCSFQDTYPSDGPQYDYDDRGESEWYGDGTDTDTEAFVLAVRSLHTETATLNLNWNDYDNRLNARPARLRLVSSALGELFVNSGDAQATVTIPSIHYSHLRDLNPFAYTVDLTYNGVGDYYTASGSLLPTSYPSSTITMTLQTDTVFTMKGIVNWQDDSDSAGLRPDDYAMALQWQNAAGEWADVPEENILSLQKQASGNRTQYTYQAEEVDGAADYRIVQRNVPYLYDTEETSTVDASGVRSYTFTNTLSEDSLTSFTANVSWANEDGSTQFRPSKVGLHLYYTEEGSDEKTAYGSDVYILPTDAGYTWDNLPAYSENGAARTYTAVEDTISAYATTYGETQTDSDGQAQSIVNTRSDDWNYFVDLFWLTDDPADKLSYESVTTSSSSLTVQYQLTVLVNSQVYEENMMTIRIPYYLGELRNDKGWVKPTLELPDHYPTDEEKAALQYPFYYTVDDKGTDDPSDDEMVLQNWQAVGPAYKIEIPVSYTFQPVNWPDRQAASLQASASAQSTTQAYAEEQATPQISYSLDTGVQIHSFEKSVLRTGNNSDDIRILGNFYASHASAGRIDPLDYASYNYVEYEINASISYNQPYALLLQDTPGQQGEIVAVLQYLYSSYSLAAGKEYLESHRTENADGTITYSISPGAVMRSSGYSSVKMRVLVRYPKSEDAQEDEGKTYSNDASMTIQGTDEPISDPDYNDSDQASDKASYMWVNYDWLPTGDLLWYYKELDYRDFLTAYGVTMLENGRDVPLAGSIQMEIYGENLSSDEDDPSYLYSMEMTDSDLYWMSSSDEQFRRMTSSDYTFTSVTLSLTNTDTDKNTGLSKLPSYESPSDMIFTVQYRDAGTGEWTDWYTTSLEMTSDGRDYILADQTKHSLPSGTSADGIRLAAPEGLKGHLEASVYYNILLLHDSPVVEEWLADTETPLTNFKVRNYGTYRFFRNDGEGSYSWVDALPGVEKPGSKTDFPSRSDVEANYDIPEYGKPAVHYMSEVSTSAIQSYDLMEKTTASQGSTRGNTFYSYADSSTSEYVASFMLRGMERVPAGKSETAEQQTILHSGTFYDLLPEGYVYKEGSAKGYDGHYSSYVSSREADPAVSVEVRTINNFRGTGRQMVIFHVVRDDSDADGENLQSDSVYNSTLGMTEHFMKSELRVYFQAELSYLEYQFHPTGTNLAAFYPLTGIDGASRALNGSSSSSMASSDSGTFEEGSAFYGISATDGTNAFTDLNGNGDTSSLEVMYASSTVAPNVALPTQSGLHKEVQGNGAVYSAEDTVEAGGDYSYRISYYSESTGDHGRVVLYDILEDAVNIGTTGEEGWKGTFDSVELSHIPSEIQPVIYYSTSTSLDYNVMQENQNNADVSARQDISNTTLWTTEMPADKSSITAVAVDLSTDVNGDPYIFDQSTLASFIIHMKAPAQIPQPLYAYNRAAYNSAIKAQGAAEGFESESIVIGSRVRISFSVDIPVEKVWVDSGDQYGLRPDSVTLKLLADGQDTGRSVTLDGTVDEVETESWKAVFEDLPLADEDGNRITYSLEEEDGPADYYTITYASRGETLTAVNTLKEVVCTGEMPLRATKTLDNGNPVEGQFTFELYDGQKEQGEAPLQTTSCHADGSVAFSSIHFSEEDIGKQRTYTVVEKDGGSSSYTYDDTVYTVSVTPRAGEAALQSDGTLQIEMILEPAITSSRTGQAVSAMRFANETGKKTVTVRKVWLDNGNADNVRPASLSFTLYADGDVYEKEGVPNPVTLTSGNADSTGNAWTYTWSGLPMAVNGHDIEYTVREDTVPAYYTSTTTVTESEDCLSSTVTIENTQQEISGSTTLTLEAQKTLDGTEPGNAAFEFILTGAPGNPDGWSEISQVRRSDASGRITFEAMTFTKAEIGKTFVFYIRERAGNESYAYDGSTYRVTIVPRRGKVDAQGNLTVVAVPSLAKIGEDGTEESASSILFQNTTKTTDLTVRKQWKDSDSSARPASVSVQLYQAAEGSDPIPYGSPAALTAEDGWTYTWQDLPQMADGKEVSYSVREVSSPAGYMAERDGEALRAPDSSDAHEIFILTNDRITYVPASARLTAVKTLNGSTPDRQFLFGLYLVEDGQEKLLATAKNDGSDIVFENIDALSFDEQDAGEARLFRIRELPAAEYSYVRFDRIAYDVMIAPTLTDVRMDEMNMPCQEVLLQTDVRIHQDGASFQSEEKASVILFRNITIPPTAATGGAGIWILAFCCAAALIFLTLFRKKRT